MILKISKLVNDIHDHKISKREANKQLLALSSGLNQKELLIAYEKYTLGIDNYEQIENFIKTEITDFLSNL